MCCSDVIDILALADERSWTSAELFEHVTIPLGIVGDLYKKKAISLLEKIRLEVAFQEALSNALEHGNLELDSILKNKFDENGIDEFTKLRAVRLQDPFYSSRKIRVKEGLQGDALVISISNEGPTFKVDEQFNKSVEDVDYNIYGRGIALIRANVDEVSYKDNGRTIILVKYITSASIPHSKSADTIS